MQLRIYLFLIFLFLLSSCQKTSEVDRLILTKVAFDNLPGWKNDEIKEILPVLEKSCDKIKTNAPSAYMINDITYGDFQAICNELNNWTDKTESGIRNFIYTWFVPYQATNNGVKSGVITGYYVPLLKGAYKRSSTYKHPVYAKPKDLVIIEDLSLFRPEPCFKNKRIAGRVINGYLKPYLSRKEIHDGALQGHSLELLWVDNLIDLFFMHIQGSGAIELPDGKRLLLGYHGTNGHPYLAIGKVLVEQGELQKNQVSMQSIKAWLNANPEKSLHLMNKNPSYVFFRILEGTEVYGSQQTPLVPLRSIAVDTAFIPLGIPIWLNAANPKDPLKPFQRLVVAQDTGGAIRGPVRADLFVGFGTLAGDIAGYLNEKGNLYLLLPKKLPQIVKGN